ncbi:MAG: STAS domain-containing protein [Oscillospiraceae bacterium]|nr:STAS domain-containing protein [Oscillospiraceae bacterium]
MLNIQKTNENGTLTVALEGRLDTASSPKLETELNNALPGVQDLVFDLEKLEYISSAGLRVLLLAQKAMNRQGSMKLVRVNDIVREVLEVTGFTEILTIE